MNAPEALIAHTSDRVFRELAAAPAGNTIAALNARWTAIDATGLDRILVPEAQGGIGADLADVVAMLRLAGCHAVEAPVFEATVGRWISARAVLAEPPGLVVLATPAASRAGGARRVDIPYGRAVGNACFLDFAGAAPVVVAFAVDTDQLECDEDLAGEPRDRMTVPENAARGRLDITQDRFEGLCALLRAAQMQGAMQQALSIAIEHANTREQFGRPIGQFQAVQQMLAIAAAQVAGVAAAVDGATAVMRDERAWIGGALAKARASEAAATVVTVVHQVTAAMGFTREFPLHRFTRRLWAWRDEFGSEQVWHTRIGSLVLARGAGALWPFIVAPETMMESR